MNSDYAESSSRCAVRNGQTAGSVKVEVKPVGRQQNGVVVNHVQLSEQTTSANGTVHFNSTKHSRGRQRIKETSVKSTQTLNDMEINEMCRRVEEEKISPSVVHTKQTRLQKYLVALRPWSLSASLTPVALGSVLAYKTTEAFSLWLFLITCLTALSVHAAGNLVNTYFDYCKGVDSKKSDDRTLVDEILNPKEVARFGAFFYVMGCLGFILLGWISTAKFEHVALLYFGGLSSSFLYTGGLGLKYIALGDIAIFFSFGPLTVMFSYLAQTGELSAVPLLYAIPLALNTEAILHANNTRDMETDRQVGIFTLAIIIGPTLSYILFVLLMFVPYITFVLVGVHCTAWMFLPVISIGKAFEAERLFREKKLRHLPQHVAKLNLILGFLYVISCYAAKPGKLPYL